MRQARDAGFSIFSFHPLQSFADSEATFRGCFITIEGDEEAMPVAESLAVILDARYHTIKAGAKILYHAAAVMACGGFVALEYKVLNLFEKIGIPREAGLAALMPILRGTLDNLARLGPESALTGPFARGDSGTIKAHIEKMKESSPDIVPVYNILGKASLEIADLPVEVKSRIKNILEA